MDAFRTKVASERLCQAAHCELRWSKRDRFRPGLHARGCPGEEHYATTSRNHCGRDFLGCDKRPEGVDPPVCFVLIGRDLRDISEAAAARVVEEHFRLAEVLANGAKRFGDLLAVAYIATEIQHARAALPDLAGECFQIVRLAREHRDGVGRSEATGQCGAEARTNSSYDRDRFARLTIHNWFTSKSRATILSNSAGLLVSIST